MKKKSGWVGNVAVLVKFLLNKKHEGLGLILEAHI